MANELDPATNSDDTHAQRGRIAFERLRERTDELELIISGLLAFALLAAPTRIFDMWARNNVHIDGVLDFALQFGFMIGVGLCYSLAFAFISHLAIRGYWVSLIGLKSTFPDGIRWERIPMMGVVSRPFYQKVVGDLGASIDRADRAASILFAMTILVALLMAWIGVLAIAGTVACWLIGQLFVDSERAARIAMLVGYVLFMLLSVTPMSLDKLVAWRQKAGHPAPALQRWTRGALRMVSSIIPQRLISPVQLTLQSNLPSKSFMTVYFLVVMLAMLFGGLQVFNSASFSLFNGYRVITTEAVDHGMLSAHYESLRSDDDVLRLFPMIPSDRISESHLRVFLPHRPKIDNLFAQEHCTALAGANNDAKGHAAARQATTCLATMWTITLDGVPIAMDDFVPMERRDLALRGLVGYIDIGDLPPGRHDLYLAWNAQGPDSGTLRKREYFIPFWLAPGLDQSPASR